MNEERDHSYANHIGSHNGIDYGRTWGYGCFGFSLGGGVVSDIIFAIATIMILVFVSNKYM